MQLEDKGKDEEEDEDKDEEEDEDECKEENEDPKTMAMRDVDEDVNEG